MSRHDGALKGIRTVDLCRVISGPAAIETLASQCAKVIKMEGLPGNITRNGRSASPGFAPGFVSCNRGKCSIALDLKHSDDQAILRRLLESADIVAQNYRPGVIQRLSFRYAMAAARNPRIVFLSVSGVGPKGPYANKRAYDPTTQALSGLTYIQAEPISRHPKMAQTLIADKTMAIFAARQ
jgi:crotonobetainyl-CoA:carnitine CoA-transferase CaiB-like acyl-CoA transferase